MPAEPAAILVMGVSGSGKSTVGAALAERIGYAFEDGDSFHSAANIAKMHAGIPLTDEDRRPWLRAIARALDDAAERKEPVVIACSALKHAYRRVLIHGRSDVLIVYLKGSPTLIAARMAQRHGHFMPTALLDSQFETLEEPSPAENAITVDVSGSVRDTVDAIIQRMGAASQG